MIEVKHIIRICGGVLCHDYIQSGWKEVKILERIIWKKSKFLKPNRISGSDLNTYFQDKYPTKNYDNEKFKEVVHLNSKEHFHENAGNINDIVAYTLNGDIYVGIDLKTGFFHIESEDVSQSIPIYDDLFITRGLSKEDLQNYVIVGQFLELKEL